MPKTFNLQVLDNPDLKKFKQQVLREATKIWEDNHPDDKDQRIESSAVYEVFKLCRDVYPTLMKEKNALREDFHKNKKHKESENTCSLCSKNNKLKINQNNIWKAIETKLKNEGRPYPTKNTCHVHIKAWIIIQLYLLELLAPSNPTIPKEWSKLIDKKHVQAYKRLQRSLFPDTTLPDEIHSLDIAKTLYVEHLTLPKEL